MQKADFDTYIARFNEDIKVAYLSFIYTDVNGTAKDLGIPH